MAVVMNLVVLALKLMNLVDVILQKIGIKLCTITKRGLLKGKFLRPFAHRIIAREVFPFEGTRSISFLNLNISAANSYCSLLIHVSYKRVIYFV